MCDTRTAFEWKIGWDALSESKLNLRLRGWSIYFLLGSLVFNPIYATMCLRSQEFAEDVIRDPWRIWHFAGCILKLDTVLTRLIQSQTRYVAWWYLCMCASLKSLLGTCGGLRAPPREIYNVSERGTQSWEGYLDPKHVHSTCSDSLGI